MFVVMLAGLQAVVELAEELVEQVPLGLVVPIPCGAAGVVVATASHQVQRSVLDPAERTPPPLAPRAAASPLRQQLTLKGCLAPVALIRKHPASTESLLAGPR